MKEGAKPESIKIKIKYYKNATRRIVVPDATLK